MVSDLDFLDDEGKYPPLGEFDNQKALRGLEREQRDRVLECIILTLSLVVEGGVNALIGLGIALYMKRATKELEDVSNLIYVMKTLLGRFSDIGI